MDEAVLDDASPEPGMGDDTFDALGKQIADVLRSAHQTAETVQENAERDAEALRARAREEAEQAASAARQQLEQAAEMLEEARQRDATVRADTEAFVRDQHAEIERRQRELISLRQEVDDLLPAAIALVAAAQLEAARRVDEHRAARDELASLVASLTALSERQLGPEVGADDESAPEIDLRPDAPESPEATEPEAVTSAVAGGDDGEPDGLTNDERVEAAVRAAVARAIDISTAETTEGT